MNIVIAIKGMMEEKFWKFKCPTYVNVGTKIHPQGWPTTHGIPLPGDLYDLPMRNSASGFNISLLVTWMWN